MDGYLDYLFFPVMSNAVINILIIYELFYQEGSRQAVGWVAMAKGVQGLPRRPVPRASLSVIGHLHGLHYYRLS